MEAARVGVILDSSILIAAERAGQTVRQILTDIRATQGEIDIGLSVVTMAELFHGAYRADSEARQQRRLEFIAELRRGVPLYPVSLKGSGWWAKSEASKRPRASGSPSRTW